MNASPKLPSPTRWIVRAAFLFLASVLWVAAAAEGASPVRGPLRASAENPRYFADGSGKIVYLTGSHTWNNLQIMLFEGWGLQFVRDGWKAHPFHPANNSSGIGAGLDSDSAGLTIFTLAHAEITRLQEAYVRKVIDTVNDLDNVLFEISNENHPPSTEWQHHFIRFIREHEKTQPKQHPVGMTFQYKDGKNSTLWASPADWVSPNPDADAGFEYRGNPPPADGRKVILSDTDHLWGIGGDAAWVWKSFLRGLNPLFMDPYKREILSRGSDDQWEPARRALGQTRRLAEAINLAAMVPHAERASTGYCLAQPGHEYVVFQPKPGEPFSVELEAGSYQMQWWDPTKGAVAEEARFETKGGKREFKAPFNGACALHVRVQNRAAAASFELPRMWEYSPPLISPEARASNPSRAQKDPSVVFYGGKWHVFMTVKLPGRSAIEYGSFEKWEDANASARTILQVSASDYYCAPQVFYFTPHKKWYLIYQVGVPGADKMWVAYSTTTEISKPESWTPAMPMLDGGKDDPRKAGGLDYWIICDPSRAYLFLTSLDGRMWRLWTRLEDFPQGFGHCELALEAKIFEASHTYKLKGTGRYLTLIEENGRRYYKAYLADRLDGTWTPIADSAERPFAGWNNIRPASGVEPWTDNISHGELIRDGYDETLTVDPRDLRFLFQGMWDQHKSGKGYGQFQWRLGLLTPVANVP